LKQNRNKFQLAIINYLYWPATYFEFRKELNLNVQPPSRQPRKFLHMLMIEQIIKCFVALIIDWKFMKIGSTTIKKILFLYVWIQIIIIRDAYIACSKGGEDN
jgi:hypothetical protein